MRHVNKKLIISISTLILIAIIVYQTFYSGSHSGSIRLSINGVKTDLTGIEISLDFNDNTNDSPSAITTIRSHQFKFPTGCYGMNRLFFIIPKKMLGTYGSDLVVNLKTFNENGWHDVKHIIDMTMTINEDDNCLVSTIYKKILPITDKSGLKFNVIKTVSSVENVSIDNSKISLYLD